MTRLPAILLAIPLLAQNPRVAPADVPAFTVMGYAARTTNARERSRTDGRIGPLWARLMHGGSQAIPGVIDRETIYAVYTGYETNETGAYDVILGKSVQPEQQAPADMRSLHVPSARYLVFAAAGNSPDAITTAWLNVYEYFVQHPQPRRAFTIDFEQHSGSRTRLFIAVRPFGSSSSKP